MIKSAVLGLETFFLVGYLRALCVTRENLSELLTSSDIQQSRKGLEACNELPHGKPTMWFLNRSDTNQTVQTLKIARGWKF